MSLKRILNIIKSHNKFIISAHVDLEGDALGAELALARLLEKIGKKAFIINADKTPRIYNFLPGINSIINSQVKIPSYDVFISLDCCNKRRLGKVLELINKDKIIINIDHHKSNDKFGDVNWIAPGASSVSEMIYQIYKKLNLKIDRASALLLYVGILTDTGSFRYSNTNSNTHRIVADLLSRNLSVNKIYQNIYESNPLAEMKIVASILNSFRTERKSGVAWVEIKSNIRKKLDTKVDITDNIFNFLRSIEGIEVAIIFKEISPNQTKVNFRSKNKIDVARFASNFGGGGHYNASGCLISKGLRSAERLILSRLKRLL
jgi:phosphoesterase RecJ-like protein